MLLWLSELLAREVRAFNVFGYLSLRAVLATMTALIISFVIGPRMIEWLARMKIGQSVRDDGPMPEIHRARIWEKPGHAETVEEMIETGKAWPALFRRRQVRKAWAEAREGKGHQHWETVFNRIVWREGFEEHLAELGDGHAVMAAFERREGGTVVNVGVTDWVLGLGDPVVERITRNMHDRLSR